jgi:hypothetical protein
MQPCKFEENVRKSEKGSENALEDAEHGLDMYSPCSLNEV